MVKKGMGTRRMDRRSFVKSGALSLGGLALSGKLLANWDNCIKDRDSKRVFRDKALGCFMGAAIGDSLGGPVECQHYLRIRKYAGDFSDLLPFGRPVSVFEPPEEGWAMRKDPGTITDDTYIRMDLLKFFLIEDPPFTTGKLAAYLDRSSSFFGWWDPPKNHVRRVINGEFPASEAGKFMDIQGGGGGWWQPAAIIHAGDPAKACEVATELCSIWKTGLARNILGAVVAGQASAFKKGGTIDSVVKTILDFSSQKARGLFERAINIGLESKNPDQLYQNLYSRASVANSTHTGEFNQMEGPLPPAEVIPYTEEMCSSIAFAEQQPWALAYLVYGNGDPEKTLLTAVKGGRDADSIATNTASWLGALYGLSIWPEKWVQAVRKANLADFDLLHFGEKLAERALDLGFVHL